MSLKKDYLGLRLVLLVIACFLIGLGAKLAKSSTLGADVVVLVWEGLERTFGINISTGNIIVSLVFLAITLSINWRYIGFGTVVGMFLQSFFIDLFNFSAIAEMDITVKVVAMVVGIALIAMGCAVYALAELGVGPYIAATLALHEKFKTSIPKNKFFIDASCVITAAILGQWPTIGPVVSLLISGVIMDQTMVILKKFLPIK